MSIEYIKNRDLLFKLAFLYLVKHILRIFGIDEEVMEFLSTEIISIDFSEDVRLFDNFLDLRILTKSGKVLLIEFKKNSITTADLKQLYKYFLKSVCVDKRECIPILITISEKGAVSEYKKSFITFHPDIIKSKTMDKQEDLNTIRTKLKNNEVLSPYECSLLVTLPLFKTDTDEADLVRETCGYFQYKKDCIIKDELGGMVAAMYLNIIEYNFDEKEKLWEDIDLSGETEGLIAQFRNEGKRQLLELQLENHSIEEIAEFTNVDEIEIGNILSRK